MTLPRRRFLHLAAGAVTLPMLYAAGRTQTMRPLAERLADYAHGLHYDDLDVATIERVKVHTIDSIGCAIAAFDEKPVRICREVALASGESGATVIGTRRRVAADLATFANCAAIRYLDLNDAYVGRVTGPPTRLTATLDDGRHITRLVDSVPGFPGQPISRADVERKFRSNVGRRWPSEHTDAVLQALWALDRTDSLSLLLANLALPA
jgi:2-methylcitrate dehydratase PrpD